jgi:DNA-directed RNA polymerase subunit RPC12/RpoP
MKEPYTLHIVDADGDSIAEVFLDDAPVRDYNDMQEHNARLLAAAPDLLQALLPFTLGEADLTNSICHQGICSAEQCGRCSKILQAREAVRYALSGQKEKRVARVEYVCDICGKPAVAATRDMRQVPSPENDGTACWEPVEGSKRIRCAEHKEDSRSYDLEGKEIKE